MKPQTRFGLAVCALIGVFAAGLLAGCSGAKADPLQVTYYYLPG